MEIIRSRMVHLGYGRFWRSDEIVGLCPIEKGRGPGRRTEVHVSTREEPLIASRSERSILQEMVRLPAEEFQAVEARDLLRDLLDDLTGIPQVLRRLLQNEARVDFDVWERRVSALLSRDGEQDPDEDQEDLFAKPG